MRCSATGHCERWMGEKERRGGDGGREWLVVLARAHNILDFNKLSKF